GAGAVRLLIRATPARPATLRTARCAPAPGPFIACPWRPDVAGHARAGVPCAAPGPRDGPGSRNRGGGGRRPTDTWQSRGAGAGARGRDRGSGIRTAVPDPPAPPRSD